MYGYNSKGFDKNCEDAVAMVLLLLCQGFTADEIKAGMEKRYGVALKPRDISDIKKHIRLYLSCSEKAREVFYMISDESAP